MLSLLEQLELTERQVRDLSLENARLRREIKQLHYVGTTIKAMASKSVSAAERRREIYERFAAARG